jgi:hypothetical protein
MHPSLLLQPRANSPSWPTEPVAPANGADGSTAVAAPAPGTTVTATGGDNGGSFAVTAPPSGYLTQGTCQEASRSGLIAAGGYTVGASLVGIVIFVVRKKLWGSAFVRYLTGVGVACILGTTVAGLDPVRADILEQCMHSADFSQYVFLGTQLFARALVLGLVPTLVVTLAACLVANRT